MMEILCGKSLIINHGVRYTIIYIDAGRLVTMASHSRNFYARNINKYKYIFIVTDLRKYLFESFYLGLLGPLQRKTLEFAVLKDLNPRVINTK